MTRNLSLPKAPIQPMHLRRYRSLMRAYNILLHTACVLAGPLMLPFLLMTEKRRCTLLPRLGLAGLPVRQRENDGRRVLWVHALSVGETLSAVPLVKGLRAALPDCPLFFSVSTHTGFQIAAAKLKDSVHAVFYYPYDLLPCVRRVIRRIDPALVILVESDIWPNFVMELERRQIPAFLVNARLSDRSLKGYRHFQSFSAPLFSSFAAICAQSAADARRFRRLGVPADKVRVTGNLKFGPAAQAPDPQALEVLERIETYIRRQKVRHVLVAGSVHAGEAVLMAEAFSGLQKDVAGLFALAVPRDPQKSALFRRAFTDAGLRCLQYSDLHDSGRMPAADVLVVDRMGVLKDLYRLADVAFVGGSLIRQGGHNPLEPAAWAKPVLFGPHMQDFRDVAARLIASGGALQVASPVALRHAAADFCNDPRTARAAGRAARDVLQTGGGAVEKILDVIRSQWVCHAG